MGALVPQHGLLQGARRQLHFLTFTGIEAMDALVAAAVATAVVTIFSEVLVMRPDPRAMNISILWQFGSGLWKLVCGPSDFVSHAKSCAITRHGISIPLIS